MSDETRRAMTFEDLWALPRLGELALSPDGRRVLYTATTFDLESNMSTAQLWLVETAGEEPPRQLTFSPGKRQQPCWSPDGDAVVYAVARDEEPARLERLRLDGGEPEPLGEVPTATSRPRYLPDGSALVFAASTWPAVGDDLEAWKARVEEGKEDKTKAKISERRLLRFWDEYRTDGSVTHLFRLDLDSDPDPGSAAVRDLMSDFDQLTHLSDFAWDLASDGRELTFAANATPEPWHELRFALYRLPLAGGAPERLLPEHPGWDSGPIYSPDGRFLIFGRIPRPERSSELTRLMRFDRESGEVMELMPGWDREPSGWVFTPGGETILFHAQESGRRHLYALPAAGGAPRAVVRGGTTSAVEAGPEGRVVYLRQSFRHPPEIATLVDEKDASEPAPRRLASPHDELLAGVDLGAMEERTFVGADGDEIQAFVVTPPGFDRSKRWPLVLTIHGGPHSAWLDQWHWRWSAPLLAAPGYVVLMVNPHGSTGFGQAFAESILGDHASKPFADLMAAVDALVAEPWIDPDRLAAAGASYGGYLVAWILGHSDRFQALVDHAGVYDLMAQYASDYTWSRSTSYGAEPWQDPARIDRASPNRFARNFSTPTLILHGERDYRVPVNQGLELYGVLQGKGIPSRIVIFPDENHWVQKPQAARLWWREVHAWLARHVEPGPGRP